MSMGFYGASHDSLEDLATMRTIADLAVVCAIDANHLRAVLRTSVDHPRGIYLRPDRGPVVHADVPDITFGQALSLREGRDVTLMACGSEVHTACVAADHLAATGISATAADMCTIKPLDRDAVLAAAQQDPTVTLREHNRTGGLGSTVADVLADEGAPLLRHGIAGEFVKIRPPSALYAHYRLDAAGIGAVVEEFVQRGCEP